VIKVDSTCPGPASRSVSAIPKLPGSSRGGATGYSQKHPNPAAVVTASDVRARAYRSGWRSSSQPSATAGIRK
jgi:hypothetical protein